MRVYERAGERWEIELHELRVVARRFENDALVDESPVEHASPLRAKWEADKLCSRLAANGYTRQADLGEAPAPLGRRELEDALRANPDDLETYLVFADWLSERGDEWGQLIAVQHALRGLRPESPRHDELSRLEVMLRYRHGGRLWGRLGETVISEATQTYLCDLIDADWHCGFLRAVRLRHVPQFAEVATTLNELATAMLLREITLVENVWDEGTIEAFANRPWPMLERVVIVGRTDARRLVPLLMGNTPRLVHLDVWESTDSDALCAAIADGPLAPQLQSIALRACELSQLGIDRLASARFGALAKLEIGGVLPDGAYARLRSCAPVVRVFEEQQRYDDY